MGEAALGLGGRARGREGRAGRGDRHHRAPDGRDEAGEGVAIDPPVYMPFATTIRRLGRTVVESPVTARRLDLAGLERAYAKAGARVHLLC